MTLDATTIAAIATAGGTVGAGLGYGLKAIVDAIVRLRKSRTENNMEVAKHEDAQAKEAYSAAMIAHDKLNAAFESRVKALEESNLRTHEELKFTRQELKQAREEHTKCQVEQEKLRGDLKALQVHVDRLWAHDKANKENVDGLKKTLETKLASDSGLMPMPDELKAEAERFKREHP